MEFINRVFEIVGTVMVLGLVLLFVGWFIAMLYSETVELMKWIKTKIWK
jgi:hypothetical protein